MKLGELCIFIPESEYENMLQEMEKLKLKIEELEKRPIPLEEKLNVNN